MSRAEDGATAGLIDVRVAVAGIATLSRTGWLNDPEYL